MSDFDRVAERIRELDSGDVGTGVSEDAVTAAEAALAVKLVGGYREFLLVFGFGGVEDVELYGLGGPDYLDVVQITKSERAIAEPQLPHHLVPIWNDGGGNLYCLNTREGEEHPIVFWDHELGSDQAPDIDAPDFATWMMEQLDGLD